MMPMASLTSSLISYLRALFSRIDMVGANYLWNTKPELSRIRIGGVFVVDSKTPLSQPYVTVQRGPASYSKIAIANLVQADELETEVIKGDFLAGGIAVTVGARTALEASNLAQFIAEFMQTDRGQIIEKSRMLRNFQVVSVGAETPKVIDSQIHRVEVVVGINAETISLNRVTPMDEAPFNITEYLGIDWRSGESTGSVSSNVLNTGNVTFGFDNTKTYYLSESDLNNGKYFAIINGDAYKVKSVIDDTHIEVEGCTLNKEVEFSIIWNTSGLHWILTKENV